ncbi:MAG: bifunctional oligoribonuclease/PAP phosphatase NrnA [Bacteroidales bacterium]
MKITAQQIKKLVEKVSQVIIVSHENPDGDAIGSSLALGRFLQLLGKEVTIALPGPFPTYYQWMSGSDKIVYYAKDQEYITNVLIRSDTLFAVDISTLSRTGKMAETLSQFKGTRVLIDHHIHPCHDEFDHVFSDVTVSSTSELIYHLIDMMGLTDKIDEQMAEALYVGIMTDTGSYSFNCNSPMTYDVTAQLVRKGILPDRIHKLVYDNNTENRIRLLGYALEKMVVLPEFHTAYIALDRDELLRNKSQIGDTEGIVNFALSIKGVVLAAFFSLRDGEIKISFRSKGRFSVNDFAKNHFNGGGHLNAAGGSFKGKIKDAVKAFVDTLPDYQKELSKHNEGF